MEEAPHTEPVLPTYPVVRIPTPEIQKKPPIPQKPRSEVRIGVIPSILDEPISKPRVPLLPTEPELLQWPADKSPFGQPDDPSVIVFETDPVDGRQRIKAATPVKLVEKATEKLVGPNFKLC